MITIKDNLIIELELLGMSSTQANEVLELAEDEVYDVISEHGLSYESDGTYPQAIYDILMKVIKPIALVWIDGDKLYFDFFKS